MSTPLLLTALFALAPAQAETSMAAPDMAAPDMDCRQTGPAASAPAHGASDVPVDAEPLVQFTGDCGSYVWNMSLKEADSGLELANMVVDYDSLDPSRTVAVELVEPLEADTTYVLRIQSEDGYDEPWESVFSTGDHLMVGVDGAPVVESLDLTRFGEQAVVEVGVSAQPAADPDGMSTLHFELQEADGDTFRGFQIVQGDDAVVFYGVFPTDGVITEGCLVAVQTDGLGQEHRSEPLCAAVDVVDDKKGLGCMAVGAPASATLGLLGFLGLLGLARRRR